MGMRTCVSLRLLYFRSRLIAVRVVAKEPFLWLRWETNSRHPYLSHFCGRGRTAMKIYSETADASYTKKKKIDTDEIHSWSNRRTILMGKGLGLAVRYSTRAEEFSLPPRRPDRLLLMTIQIPIQCTLEAPFTGGKAAEARISPLPCVERPG